MTVITTFTPDDLVTFGKEKLRQLCRDNGLSYGKLNNDGMRQLLNDKLVFGVDPDGDDEEVEATVPPSTLADLFGLNPAKVAPENKNVTRVVDGKKQGEISKPVVEKTTHRSYGSGYNIQSDRPTQNGIRRPSVGTITEAIWSYYDKNPGVKFSELKAGAADMGWNSVTMHRQYQEWRRFNNLIPAVK